MRRQTDYVKDKSGKFAGSRPLPVSPTSPVPYDESTVSPDTPGESSAPSDTTAYDTMLLQARALTLVAEKETMFSYFRSVQLDSADGTQLAHAYHLLATEGEKLPVPVHYALLFGDTVNPTVYFNGSDSLPHEGDIIVLPPLLMSEKEEEAEGNVEKLEDSLPEDSDNYAVRIIIEGSTGVPTALDREWLVAGEYEVTHVDENPIDSDAYSVVTLRQTEAGTRHLQPVVEEGDRVIHQRYGPRVISTVAMNQETRYAYKAGQCYALADALAEQLGDDALIGVTVSGVQNTLPWGTRLEDTGGVLTGDWFNQQAIHAVAVGRKEGTYVDVDGEQDILALKENVEDLHAGSLVTMTRTQMRELLTTAPLCFPQDYDTARLVARTVLTPD